jgi:hypothetical protein
MVLCTSAVSADSRYASIVERNVFGLKPPPPPPDPEASKPPPSNITLTGIITLGGKKALMTTPPTGGKPGVPATPESYILKEGERQGAIEVLSIDEVNFVVKVRNAGQEQTLDFKNNGPKLAAGPPPAPPQGMPGAMPGQPGFNPANVGRPAPTPGAMPTPMPNFDRNVRTTTGNSAAGGNLSNPTGMQTAAGAIPGFGASTQRGGIDTSALPAKQYSLEEQQILIEANRQTSPFGSLLPPTALSPRANVQDGQPQNQPPNPGGR